MKFYDGLMISDKIELSKEELIKKIEAGDVFFHTYLVVVPLKEIGNQIEYFHVEISRQSLYNMEDYVIVGVALGKSEAKEMVGHIIENVYQETKCADIRKYFMDKSAVNEMEKLC